jgi:malonyl-CoA O-methyltransferase
VLTRFPDSKIICLDFAQEALKKNPTKNKLCADANHLPLSNNCVDIIISNYMGWIVNHCPAFFKFFKCVGAKGGK